jgi:hypothetical protein
MSWNSILSMNPEEFRRSLKYFYDKHPEYRQKSLEKWMGD